MEYGEQPSVPVVLRGSRASGTDQRPREAARSAALLSWRTAAIVLVLVVWLIPIKGYTFPVALPFNLEPYRLLIVALVFAWAVSALLGAARLDAAGQAAPVAALAIAGVAALLANRDAINAAGIQSQAVKSLSFFLSYLIVFVLLASMLSSMREIEAVVRWIVGGALVVTVGAIIEARTNYNAFNHLHSVIPVLDHIGKDRQNFAGGTLRVRASAQHPVALGVVLMLCVPLAFYLASRASTRFRASFWMLAAGAITTGAVSTKSRTIVLFILALLITTLLVYGGKPLLRRWPLVLALVALMHVASPGAISHLYKRFTPKEGLVQEQSVRAGQAGSGRLADVVPGLGRWSGAPLFGRGLGTVAATGERDQLKSGEMTFSVIFDNQYMNTLVTLGGFGLVAVLWFVWGVVRKLTRAARRLAGGDRDLLGACAISCAGFGAAMLTYDAFSFVQSTLMFFIIAALGLRARSLLTQ